MTNQNNQIYEDHILELYENKPNFGNLKDKTHTIKQNNPVCDDEIILDVKIKKGIIEDIKFSGKTCFISTISAAALTENIKGMKIEDIKKLTKKNIDNFLGKEIISTRITCELLALEALKKIK